MSTTTTTPCPPDRSLLQRREALLNANRIRSYRADLKRDIKAGRRHVLQLITDPPPELLTMKVGELLLAVPGVGSTKLNKAMRSCAMSVSKTLGGMTDRQRSELARLLVSMRPVGVCSACGHPLVRLATDTAAASCECGASDIPHGFFDAARRAAA